MCEHEHVFDFIFSLGFFYYKLPQTKQKLIHFDMKANVFSIKFNGNPCEEEKNHSTGKTTVLEGTINDFRAENYLIKWSIYPATLSR